MKKWILFIAVGVLSLACEDTAISVEEFPNWVRISIPKGKEALAVAGDVESTLLVTTASKAFYTTDMGQNWIESKDFQGPVYGLLQRNDTIVALFSKSFDQDQATASLGYLFTLDLGRTWQYDPSGKFMKAKMPIGSVESDWGVKYRVVESLKQLQPAPSGPVHPSSLQKWPHLNNDWGALDFPVKVKANNVYLDKKNRLYVAAASGDFDENNCHAGADEKSPAWIFISKRPLPQ
jgi:hypothetical protein